jgi:Holliday junction resolvase RusA-like endonuclease
MFLLRKVPGKILNLAMQQFKDPPLTGYLALSCGFYFLIPKSTSNKKRTQMLLGAIRPVKKPDLSNCIKFIEDCLNGLVWQDDSQIVSYGSMGKWYAEEPKTIIRIEMLGGATNEGVTNG